MLAAVKYLESQFSDPVTITIDVGYGEVAGNPMGGGELGSSEYFLNSYSYSTLTNALKSHATSTADASAVSGLPSGAPAGGTMWTTTAQAKALGLISGTGGSVDGYVGFSNSYGFTYNDANGVASGTYDFNATVLHEISEVMGRELLTGAGIGGTSSYGIEDLLHYSAPGVPDYAPTTPGYFSVDQGTTNLATFNASGSGDPGDWDSSVVNDSVDAYASSGVVEAFSAADLTTLDAIGWNSAGSVVTPPQSTSTPTGVAFSPVTSSLGQFTSTLTANSKIAAISQVGGSTSDSYTYQLGGAGAASFALSTANNVATLSAGPTGLGGAITGKAYALTVTATDVSSGNSSPATSLNVVVGSGGADTVQLSALAASSAAVPTFVFGLAGADHISAAGMTGQVWIQGGGGIDIMTGGSGANSYLYGAASDSTSSAMDIITNFNAASDLINLSGIGSTLKYAGQVNGSLAGHSVGWNVSGGNTYLYVNTGGGKESLTGTNMKIELQGSISLSSNNILHA